MKEKKKKEEEESYGSPDPMRFEGGGSYFKAKMIGYQDVDGARGDRLCQETMGYLKQRVKAAGVHKTKVTLNISLKGITIIDLLTGNTLHQHAVSRISFISRDTTDARAFGYIYGPGDGKHIFYAIKTEKAAEPVVLTLRDLFLVVFEMKKKEVEESKKKKEEDKENHAEKENDVEQKEEQQPEFRNPPVEQAQEPSLFDLESDFSGGNTGQGFVDMNFFGTAQAPPATPGSATSDPFSSSSGSAVSAFPAGGFEAAFPPQQQAPNLPPRPGGMPGAFPQQQQPAAAGAWATFTPSPPPGGAFPATTSPTNPFASNSAFPTSSSGNDLFGSAPLQPAMNASAKPAAQEKPGREAMFSDLVGAFGTGLESKPAKPKNELFSPEKNKTPMNQMSKPASTEPAQDDPFGMFAALGPAPGNAAPPATVSDTLSLQEGTDVHEDPYDTSRPSTLPTTAPLAVNDAYLSSTENTPDQPPPSAPPPPLPTNPPQEEDAPPPPPPRPSSRASLSRPPSRQAESSVSAVEFPVDFSNIPEAQSTPPANNSPRPDSHASNSSPVIAANSSPHSTPPISAVSQSPLSTPPIAPVNNPSPLSTPPIAPVNNPSPLSTPPVVPGTSSPHSTPPVGSSPQPDAPPWSGEPKNSPWAKCGVPKPSSNSPWPEEPIPEEFRSSPWPTDMEENTSSQNNNMDEDKFETGAWPDTDSPDSKAKDGKPGKQLPPLAIPSPPVGSPKLSPRVVPGSPRAPYSPRARPRPRVSSTSSSPGTPPLSRHASTPPTNPSPALTGSPANTPPLPRKHGSGARRGKPPLLSQRAMTMPAAAADPPVSGSPPVQQSTPTSHRRTPSTSSVTSTTSKDSDPFAAVTLPRKQQGRGVDSAIARARPRPRSKTPQQSVSSLMEPTRTGSPTSVTSVDSQPRFTAAPATPVSFTSDTVDPFANVDPFAKDEGDPFEKDPFESPSDPFAGDFTEKTEFKTKAVTSNESVSEDPFGGDPFASDPFADDTFSKDKKPVPSSSTPSMPDTKPVDNTPFDPFGLMNKSDANSTIEKAEPDKTVAISNFSTNDPFRASNKSIDSLRFDAQRNADARSSQRSTDSKVSIDSRQSQFSQDSKVSQASMESRKSLQSSDSVSSLQSQSSRDSLPPPLPQKKSHEQKFSELVAQSASPKLPPRAINTQSPKVVNNFRQSSQDSMASRSSESAVKFDSIKRQDTAPTPRQTDAVKSISENVKPNSDNTNKPKINNDSFKANFDKTDSFKANFDKADSFKANFDKTDSFKATFDKTDTISVRSEPGKKSTDPFGGFGTSAPVLGESADVNDPFSTDHIKSQFPGFGMSRAPLIRGSAVPKEPTPEPPAWAVTIKTDVIVPPAIPPAVPSRTSRAAHTESSPALPARKLSTASNHSNPDVPPPLPARQTPKPQQQQQQQQLQQQQHVVTSRYQPVSVAAKVSYPSAAPSPPRQVTYSSGAPLYPMSGTPPAHPPSQATPPNQGGNQYATMPHWSVSHDRPPQYGEVPQQQPYGSPHQHAYAQQLAYQAYHHQQQQQQPHHGSPQQQGFYYAPPPHHQGAYDVPHAPPQHSPYHAQQYAAYSGSPSQTRGHFDYAYAGTEGQYPQQQLVNGSSYYAVPPGAQPQQPQQPRPSNPFILQQQQQQQLQQQHHQAQHPAATHQNSGTSNNLFSNDLFG